MKCMVTAVLFALLLHYSITVQLNDSQLTTEIRLEIDSIRNSLIDKGLITPDRQSGFVFLGDADSAYFQNLDIKTNLVVTSKTYGKLEQWRNIYDNFLAALPLNKQTHSEDVLLNEFNPRLYNAYRARYGHAPQFILLYSYLMPCYDCTNKILNMKQNPTYSNMRWFVGYTDNYGANPAMGQQNLVRMLQGGIRIIQV